MKVVEAAVEAAGRVGGERTKKENQKVMIFDSVITLSGLNLDNFVLTIKNCKN